MKFFWLLFFGFILYANTLFSPFVFDDERNIITDGRVNNFDLAIRTFGPLHTRWLGKLSFAINYALHGEQVFGYHAVNLAIHLGNAFLIWRIVLFLLDTPIGKKESLKKHGELLAFVTALLFLAHPIQTQAVSYTVQRFASLATLTYLGSIYFYLKARLEENPDKRPISFFLAGLTALAGFYVKEITFTLPLMLILLEFFFFRKKEQRFPWWLAPGFLAFAGFTVMVVRKSYLFQREVISPLGEIINPYNYLLTQSRVIIKYLQLLFLPIKQVGDYYFPISTTLLDPYVLASMAVIFCLLASVFWLYMRNRFLSFSIAWFFLTLSVEASLIPIDDVIFEHRLYLPSFGFMLFLAILLIYLCKRFFAKNWRQRLWLVLTFLLVFYSVQTVRRNYVWGNEIRFWADVVKKSPEKAKGYGALAVAYDRVGMLDEAIEYYEKTLELNPNLKDLYLKVHNNLGYTYSKKGDTKKALEHYQKVLAVDPEFMQTHINLAQLFTAQEEYELALRHLNLLIELQPNQFAHYHNRASVYMGLERYDEARADFMKAIELNPNSQISRVMLSKLPLGNTEAISN